MINKLFIIVAGLMVMTINASSQTEAAAKKILETVSTKIKNSNGISAMYSMTVKSKTGKLKGSASGKIAMKGNKYYIKQGAEEIISNGKKIWNYNGANEVTVTDQDEDNNSLSPEKLFSGEYDNDYTYKVISSTSAYNQVQLIPTDKRKPFLKIVLSIDKSKSLITRAQVTDKNYNTTLFSLSGVDINARISDEIFIFNKNKYNSNVEVIE